MEKWTAPAIASLRGDNTIPLQRTFASLTEYLSSLSASYMPTGGTAGQILAKIDATDYNTQWIDNFAEKTKTLVKSDHSSTLPKGAAVYTSGANGTNILVKGAIATSDATSATVLGLLDQSLATNDQGYVITEGLVTGIDTSAAVAGDPVWLSPTVIGGLTFGLANKPHAPYHLVYLGVVTRAHAVNGEINVHILNGWELEELHNVSALSPTTGDTIIYNASTSLWEKGKYPASYVTGLAASATTDTTDASNITSGTLPSARLSGSYTGITAVGTLAAGSVPSSLVTGLAASATTDTTNATNITSGTLASARLSGSYTGITGVGTITTGTWSGSFGAVSGANLTSLNASNLGSGTVPSARVSGSYTGITAVGTLTSKLNVDGASSANIGIGDWSGGAVYAAIETPNAYLLLGTASDPRVYLRCVNTSYDVRIGTPSTDTLIVSNTSVTMNGASGLSVTAGGITATNGNIYISGSSGSFFQHASNTGSGQAAQWATVFGVYYLVRNTSTKADKENIQPLNGVLTPQMIDAIDVTLWNRKIAPNIPEVGPMAEDMNDISPFLATHGMDVDENGDICRTPPNGISPNGWMSLLTIAIQDCRRRIEELESR